VNDRNILPFDIVHHDLADLNAEVVSLYTQHRAFVSLSYICLLQPVLVP
jgi:hypothetical protein